MSSAILKRSLLLSTAALLAYGSTAPLSAQRLGQDMPMMRPHVLTFIGFDELEYLATGDERATEYDGAFWIGGDWERLWIKAAGEHGFDEGAGEVEAQLLYGRTIAPFWDWQVGSRIDHRYGDAARTRVLVGTGFQGLAPYWFEVEAFAWVSHEGDVSARVEASYDLLLTQRFVVESEVEANLAVQSVEAWGLGSGINDVELGARIRYEFLREFAPYVGYSWTRRVGETADLARAAGDEVEHGAVVLGLHWWW